MMKVKLGSESSVRDYFHTIGSTEDAELFLIWLQDFSSKAVNNQGFGNKVRHGREDFIFDFFSSWSQSLGAIIVGVHEERHPVEVGQTKGSAKVGNSVIIKIRQKLSKKARQHTQNYTLW